MHHSQRRSLSLLLSFSVSLALSACEGKLGGDDEVGELIDNVYDSNCDNPKQCMRKNSADKWEVISAFCADPIYALDNLTLSEQTAEILLKCRSLDDDPHDPSDYLAQALSCDSSAQADCTNWSPESVVSPGDDGATDVDGQTLLALIEDPDPLTTCDTSRFSLQDGGGGFFATNVSEGDLAYALGLRSGDLVISLDSQQIVDYSDAMNALIYFSELPEGPHTLQINRDGHTLKLRYEVSL
ncbi:hypothetical protein G6O69_17165 [Pseudenhygromyxa sp. WMMC2535]|uniref:hypothetical protein n=1 Tax=Pseudenhygromyxa sp. WMMC2535 TaxID=2712867 RepID=UPI001557CBDF|nr:hypothetical protein [Pseudenhygromyxa sp. WMMC2535]NVB39576.1 hypothetical protein [Pseudenhygromyxa sp. WMMC2535]